ncbi:MAG: esterase family protein [Erysipelotrichaceae bacterium]|nr:esterase family protein [Erysipelotrichaceae bacterium]
METFYTKWYSENLNRDMEIKVYGHHGKPIMFIPCQDGRFFDFEGFGMDNTFSPWIESGQCMVFAIDSIDKETWSDKNGDPYWRIRKHEQWINYITREVVPFIRNYVNEKNGWEGFPGIKPFGCSMGATHTLNLFLRFPDLFDGCLALSGVYNASFFLGDYMDEVVYRNSPTDYIQNMQPGHPFIEKYNMHKGIVCCGRGAWEDSWSNEHMKYHFERLGIRIWFDFWGEDVNHDWPWWHKQVPYFLPHLLADD